MNNNFEAKLNDLLKEFMDMGNRVIDSLALGAKSFLERDLKLAESVIENDNLINELEVQLEKSTLNLIALQQPVATKFRQIIVILKASSELERIGDNAVGIAKETFKNPQHKLDESMRQKMEQMHQKADKMLKVVMNDFHKNEISSIDKIVQSNMEIDNYYRDIIAKPWDSIVAEQGSEIALSINLVASYIERAGDHIINILEWVSYNKSGHLIELN